MTKKSRAYSFEHTKQRAKERYGLDLDQKTYDKWCALAKKAKAINTEKDGKVIQTTHIILWNNLKVICVYENIRDCITTVLPPEQFK